MRAAKRSTRDRIGDSLNRVGIVLGDFAVASGQACECRKNDFGDGSTSGESRDSSIPSIPGMAKVKMVITGNRDRLFLKLNISNSRKRTFSIPSRQSRYFSPSADRLTCNSWRKSSCVNPVCCGRTDLHVPGSHGGFGVGFTELRNWIELSNTGENISFALSKLDRCQ